MTFVVTTKIAHALALGLFLLFVLLAHLAVKRSRPATAGADARSVRRRGLKSAIVGTDGRASTSKFQVVLWTAVVLYALAFLLLWGRSIGCGTPPTSQRAACTAASGARATFTRFTEAGLQPEYYVLLGFPMAAALAAKAMQTNRAEEDRTPFIEEDHKTGIVTGVAELMSDDDGDTDLVDLQYLVFNLLTVGFFVAEFLVTPTGGLPDIPATLLSLSGLSTAAYTTKKGLESATKATERERREAAPAADDEPSRRVALDKDAPGRARPQRVGAARVTTSRSDEGSHP